MAETIKKVQSNVAQMKDKADDLAHKVTEAVRDNQTFRWVGIGALVLGAGFGIWSLVRKLRSSSPKEFEVGDQGIFYSRRDDFTRTDL